MNAAAMSRCLRAAIALLLMFFMSFTSAQPSVCHCRCGIKLDGPCGPEDCMRVCGYNVSPPVDPQRERFETERASIAARLQPLLDELSALNEALTPLQQRQFELSPRVAEAERERLALSRIEDQIAALERRTGIAADTPIAEIARQTARVRTDSTPVVAAAQRTRAALRQREAALEHALRGISRVMQVPPASIRIQEDRSGVGREVLARLVPPPAQAVGPGPAEAAQQPAQAVRPPAGALPALPEPGSLDWDKLQRARAGLGEMAVVIAERREQLRRAQASVEQLSSRLGSINLAEVRSQTPSAKARESALRALEDAGGGLHGAVVGTADALARISAPVIVDVGGTLGAPEEIWVSLHQRATRVTDAISGRWGLPPGVRLSLPTIAEIRESRAPDPVGTLKRELLERLPPIWSRADRARSLGNFYRDRVQRVLDDGLPLIRDAATASAQAGGIDEMQALQDRAVLPGIAVERDIIARLLDAPLRWFIRVDGDERK